HECSISRVFTEESIKQLIIFFFQAEDGIRYWSVTGVQTCALPILIEDQFETSEDLTTDKTIKLLARSYPFGVKRKLNGHVLQCRSEERRVGKECRAGWWGCHYKRKMKGLY